MTDKEFNELFMQVVRTQHLEGYKDISTDYHLGYLHGMEFLFNYIKRQKEQLEKLKQKENVQINRYTG